MVFIREEFKAPAGFGHEFGQCLEIPIGVANTAMAQIPRENDNARLGSFTLSLPALQHAAGERMAKIMNPGLASLDSQELSEFGEYFPDRVVAQAPTLIRGKEMLRQWEETLALPGIDLKGIAGSEMQGNPAGSTKLTLPHHQHSLAEVNIRNPEAQGFRDAQSGAGQQTEQGLEGGRLEFARQLAGSLQDLGDLSGAVNKWPRTSVGWTKHIAGWKLRLRFGNRQMFGERPHHFEAAGPVETVNLTGEAGPRNGQLFCQVASMPIPIRVVGKLQQQITFALETKTQCAALGQIGPHASQHGGGFHGFVLGHGRAA
jgi:hypothetical protein